jgi:hypothetical protein
LLTVAGKPEARGQVRHPFPNILPRASESRLVVAYVEASVRAVSCASCGAALSFNGRGRFQEIRKESKDKRMGPSSSRISAGLVDCPMPSVKPNTKYSRRRGLLHLTAQIIRKWLILTSTSPPESYPICRLRPALGSPFRYLGARLPQPPDNQILQAIGHCAMLSGFPAWQWDELGQIMQAKVVNGGECNNHMTCPLMCSGLVS